MRRLIIVLFIILTFSCSKKEEGSILAGLTCENSHINIEHSLSAQLQNILDGYVEKGLPGITALIYTPSEGITIKSAGLAHVKERFALTHCNSFFSGSVAKMYTVVAAMILYERGDLSLDSKISNHLPRTIVDNLPNAKTATIRQLMNHSAGMPDHDDEEKLSDFIEKNQGSLPSAEEQLAYLYDNNPRFEAGTEFDYSSAHTLVLSLVVEQISGQHHSEIITKEIIGKIGLTETYYKNESGYPMPNNMVSGYLGKGNNAENITSEAANYAFGSQGDAGIIATAYDYFQFIHALFNYEILKKETVDIMLSEGWIYNDGSILVKAGHSGITLGGMSHVYYYPEQKSSIVVLTNSLLEDDLRLLQEWSGSTLTNTGTNYLMDRLEGLILN